MVRPIIVCLPLIFYQFHLVNPKPSLQVLPQVFSTHVQTTYGKPLQSVFLWNKPLQSFLQWEFHKSSQIIALPNQSGLM
jgi:hypothetical protein